MTKKITIVGAGALGSHLLLLARNFDVQLTVIDFDRVEQKNVLSQFHTRMGIGRNKTLALQQTMQGLFGIRIHTVPHRLTEDNVENLLGQSDLVIDCLDNAESRRVVQGFVREQNIPCLHGALSANGEFGSVIWDEFFTIDDEDVQGQATCEDGEQLPFIMQVAAQMAIVIQKFLGAERKENYHLCPGRTILLTQA